MVLSEIFVQLLFGAPAGILALLVAALGIWKKWPLVLVLAGILALPATYYLSAGLNLPLYLIALFVLGAAYAVHTGRTRIAWLLLIPLLLSTLWMTVLTIYAIFFA